MSTNALNVLTLVLIILASLGSTVCIWRACYRVLGKVGFLGLRCWRPGPISPRCKNIWLTSGGALITLAVALFLGVLATIWVDSSHSAWKCFMALLGKVYVIEGLCDDQKLPLSILASIMWIVEAAFLGFIVTIVVNMIGLGRKE